MTANKGDCGAEKDRFEHSRENVEHAHDVSRIFPVIAPVDAQEIDAEERAADDAEKVGEECKAGDEDEAREESWHDEVMNRIDAHARKSVDLFGDAHRSEFCGNGASDASREHRRRENGAEFLYEGEVDRRADSRFHADDFKLRIGLNGKNHVDEDAGEHDDGKTQNADIVESGSEGFASRPFGDKPKDGGKGKDGKITRQRNSL